MFFLLFGLFIIWSRSKYDRQSDVSSNRCYLWEVEVLGKYFNWREENGRVRTKTESGFFKKNQEKFMDSIDVIGKDIEEEKKKLFYENGKLAMNDFPPLLNKMQIWPEN